MTFYLLHSQPRAGNKNTSRLTYGEVLKVLLQQVYALRNPRYLSEMRSIELYRGLLDFNKYSLKLGISCTSEQSIESIFSFRAFG